MDEYPKLLGERNNVRIVLLSQDQAMVEVALHTDALGVHSSWHSVSPMAIGCELARWLIEVLKSARQDAQKLN